MSDITFNRYAVVGTNAQRLAFTPDPTDISVIGPGEFLLPSWWESDTGDFYIWDNNTLAWVLLTSAGGGITQLTGDGTAGPGTGSQVFTLANTAVTPGSYTSVNLTVDSKGRITAIASGSGSGDVTGPGSSTDNAIARYDGTTGKIIQDSAPIVNDDGSISTVTDPVGLQDAATKNYVDTQIAAVNTGGAAQNSFLVSGGQVVWVSGYQFDVSAAGYYIQGVLYNSVEQSVTLTAADPTFDRLDVIVVDDTGTVSKIDGTASAVPSVPNIDLGTQIQLAIILVSAGTTQPTSASSVLVYADNAGSPTEWNWTTSGSGFNVNSTNNPRSPSTKCIEGTTVAAAAYAQGQPGAGTIIPYNYDQIVLYIRSKAIWTNKRGLQVNLLLNGVVVGLAVAINRTGTFGFDSSITGSYQQIAIPISNFAVTPSDTINQIRFTDFGGSIGFYIDDITFQVSGNGGGQVQGITQAQADARYRLLSVLISLANDITGNLGVSHLNGGSGASGSTFWRGDGTWGTPSGAGNVSAAGTLTNNAIVIGQGSQSVAVISTASGILTFLTTPSSANLAAAVTDETGSGALVFATSPTLITPALGTPSAINLSNATALPNSALSTAAKTRAITAVFDNGASVLANTMKKVFISVPYACTITAVTIVADQSGSAVFGIRKCARGSFPGSLTSIVASAPPTLSTAQQSQDSTLTGWTTSISADDILEVSVTSGTTVTWGSVTLTVTL